MYRLTYSDIVQGLDVKSNPITKFYIDSSLNSYNEYGIICIGYVRKSGQYTIGMIMMTIKLYELLLSKHDMIHNCYVCDNTLVINGDTLSRAKCKKVDYYKYSNRYKQDKFLAFENSGNAQLLYDKVHNIIIDYSDYVVEPQKRVEEIKESLEDKILAVMYPEDYYRGNILVGVLDGNTLRFKKQHIPIKITDDIINAGKRLDVVFNNYIYEKYGKFGKQIIDAYVFKNYDNDLFSAILDSNKLDAVNLDDFYNKALKETADIDNIIINSKILSLTDRTIMMEFSISTMLNDRNTTFNILMSQKKEIKAKIADLYNEAIHNARYANKLAPLKFYKIDSMKFVGYVLYVTLVIKVSNMDSNVDVLDTLKH